MDYWLVTGLLEDETGEIEWPVAVYKTEEEATLCADGAKRYSLESKDITAIWIRDIHIPWFLSHSTGWFPDISERPDRPKQPERIPNPYDPERGNGDDYRVSRVRFRHITITDNET